MQGSTESVRGKKKTNLSGKMYLKFDKISSTLKGFTFSLNPGSNTILSRIGETPEKVSGGIWSWFQKCKG